ncbi:glutathione S-transferase-like protein [Hyaloscypha variabilis]
MASTIKPITFWGGPLGPNPGKVYMILKELRIPHERIEIPLSDVKKPEYTKHNPNGRLPTIHDPNTDLTIWESGAIIEYLVDKYDKDHKLSFPAGTNEYYLTKQWLYFQMSGQGPYYGQAWWFKLLHEPKIPSAIDRYINEIRRVSGVLNGVLEGREYLVGDKCTFADLAFVTWQMSILKIVEYDQAKDFPNVQAWIDRMSQRPAIKAFLVERDERMAASGKK